MQTQNYWKQFESTGKIEDYLSYRANYSQRSETGSAGCKSDYRESFGNGREETFLDDSRGGIHREGMDGDLCRDSFR